jgi:hypothetical protein
MYAGRLKKSASGTRDGGAMVALAGAVWAVATVVQA